jgi:PHD/YefM family antitoxin component YafN of YafNO toxin-antitoxin module
MYTQKMILMESDPLSQFEVVSLSKFQDNFDTYMEKIEKNRESFIIEDEEGNRAIMVPADEELIRIHTEFNNDAS